MLTFLRKIRRSLSESGSVRKYLLYAIGEILLVMLGILLALEVNNWNQRRIDHNKAELLLREINSEFLINQKELTNTLRLYKSTYEKMESVIKYFPLEDKAYDIDSLASSLQYSNIINDADLSEGSVSALINSSAFELISNPELRTLLVQWKDMVADYQKAEAMAINFAVEHYLPFMDKHIPLPYQEGIKNNQIDLTFLSSVEFKNMIKRRQQYIGIMLRIAGDDNGKLINAIDRIIELSAPNTISR